MRVTVVFAQVTPGKHDGQSIGAKQTPGASKLRTALARGPEFSGLSHQWHSPRRASAGASIRLESSRRPSAASSASWKFRERELQSCKRSVTRACALRRRAFACSVSLSTGAVPASSCSPRERASRRSDSGTSRLRSACRSRARCCSVMGVSRAWAHGQHHSLLSHIEDAVRVGKALRAAHTELNCAAL